MTKRKPTSAQLLSRVYRRQLAMEKELPRVAQLVSLNTEPFLTDIYSRLRHIDLQLGEMYKSLAMDGVRREGYAQEYGKQMDRVIEIQRKLLRGIVHIEQRGRPPTFAADQFISQPLKRYEAIRITK